MSGAKVTSHVPRSPLVCSHATVDGASITMPGPTSVRPTQPRTSLTGPKSHRATEYLCHPSSYMRIPRSFPAIWKYHSQVSQGTSHPPLPVATIFMCSPAGGPMAPDSTTSRSTRSGS